MNGPPPDPQHEQAAAAWAQDAAPDTPGPDEHAGAPEPPGPDGERRSRSQRARAKAEEWRRQADQRVEQLQARRPANRWIDAGFSTLERDLRSGGGVLAAAVAFRIFIFLVPFVFVIITAIPVGADAADADPTKVADTWGMAGLVATAIKSADGLSFWSRLSLLAAGLIALVLASRSLVRVLRITFGLAWNAQVPKLKKPTRAGLLAILAVLVLVVLGTLVSRLQDRMGLLGIAPLLLAGGAVAGFWTVVQYHLPRADVHWTKLIPGSILVGSGVEVLNLVTVVWFSRYIENKSQTYGAIGAALAILLWAYILGRIIVSGAMLNAALYEQEERSTAQSSPPPPSRPSAPPGP